VNQTNLLKVKTLVTPLYAGSADLITQDKLRQDLIKVRDDTEKQMLEDPVKLQIDSNPEIAKLFNDYVNETRLIQKLKYLI
jgi:hypothetical protein